MILAAESKLVVGERSEHASPRAAGLVASTIQLQQRKAPPRLHWQAPPDVMESSRKQLKKAALRFSRLNDPFRPGQCLRDRRLTPVPVPCRPCGRLEPRRGSLARNPLFRGRLPARCRLAWNGRNMLASAQGPSFLLGRCQSLPRPPVWRPPSDARPGALVYLSVAQAVGIERRIAPARPVAFAGLLPRPASQFEPARRGGFEAASSGEVVASRQKVGCLPKPGPLLVETLAAPAVSSGSPAGSGELIAIRRACRRMQRRRSRPRPPPARPVRKPWARRPASRSAIEVRRAVTYRHGEKPGTRDRRRHLGSRRGG